MDNNLLHAAVARTMALNYRVWGNEPPFLVRLGIATGKDDYIEQGVNELLAYSRLLQNESSGLYRH